MKIKTITCSNAENHGARLQAFALGKFLTDEGHEVEVIDYRPDYMRFSVNRWYFPGTDIKEWAKLFLRFRQRDTMIRRHEAFEKFSQSHIFLTSRKYLSYDQLVSDPPEADAYIAGSDQIWNVEFRNGNDKAFFLDFGSDKIKRLSYAASFALPELPKEKELQITKWLANFNDVSVRESSGVEILRKLGIGSCRVVDPVFLLDIEFWKQFAKPMESSVKYLLVYDFVQCDFIKASALAIARERNLKIYSVGPYPVSYADRNFTVCSPEVFVGLIENADCVLSNSFHATAFSLIFEKDFFVTNRSDGLNERMRDITTAYCLDQNILTAATTPDLFIRHIDYNKVTPLIAEDIRKSKVWLRKNLG